MGWCYDIPAWARHFDPFYGSTLCHLYVVGRPYFRSTLCWVDLLSGQRFVFQPSSPTYKHETRIEVTDSDKPSSLLQYIINDGRKELITQRMSLSHTNVGTRL